MEPQKDSEELGPLGSFILWTIMIIVFGLILWGVIAILIKVSENEKGNTEHCVSETFDERGSYCDEWESDYDLKFAPYGFSII